MSATFVNITKSYGDSYGVTVPPVDRQNVPEVQKPPSRDSYRRAQEAALQQFQEVQISEKVKLFRIKISASNANENIEISFRMLWQTSA